MSGFSPFPHDEASIYNQNGSRYRFPLCARVKCGLCYSLGYGFGRHRRMGLVAKQMAGGLYRRFDGSRFYGRWFERPSASACPVLAASVIALFFAIGLRALNAERPQEET